MAHDRAAAIDLLVTNVGAPRIDELRVAEIARQLRPDLPVALVTGYARKVADRSILLDPGMALITKPFALDVIAQKVAQLSPSHGAAARQTAQEAGREAGRER